MSQKTQYTTVYDPRQESIHRRDRKGGWLIELIFNRIELLTRSYSLGKSALAHMKEAEVRNGVFAKGWAKKGNWMNSIVKSNHSVNVATQLHDQLAQDGKLHLEDVVTTEVQADYIEQISEPKIDSKVEVGHQLELTSENEALLEDARNKLESLQHTRDLPEDFRSTTPQPELVQDAMRFELSDSDRMAGV